jgi:hypothetical protein
MKLPFAAIAALGLSLTFAQAAEKKVPFISAYAGPHNGTLNIAGVVGITTGSFQASKKKEQGVFHLQSVISSGGSTIFLSEQFIFQKKTVIWTLTQTFGSGTPIVVSGVGSASIKKNVITYTIPINYGGTTGTYSGTMRLAKNHSLTAQNILSITGSGGVLFYQLDGKKPKKPKK